MASTYVNDLRLNEMATGDGSGTWGTTTNTNLELIAEAFSYGTEVITTNADTHTTTIADGSTDPGRSLYLKYTGTLDSACTITIGPNTVSKLWFIENGTTGSQNIILSCGSGANITIPAGDTKVVYSDGAGSGAAFVDAFASLSVVDLKVQDDLTVTGDITGASLDISGDIDIDGTANLDIVDIDGAVNMATTALVTGVLTTTATQVATGGITSGSDIISDTDSTDSLGSTGVRWLKGWFDTLTAGTLTVGSGSVTDSSGAISFGDENLTTTGIVTAAGTSVFTNLDISGDIDVDGTTNLDVVDIDGAVDMATTLAVAGNVDFNGDLDVDGTTNLDVVDIDGAVDMASTLGVTGAATFSSTIAGTALYSNTNGNTTTGGNLRIGITTNNTIKYTAITSTQYAYDTESEGFALISATAGDATANSVVIGGGIDEQNAATDVRIFTGAATTRTGAERLKIDATGNFIFNESGIDADFRVESDNEANALFVEGGSGEVMFGKNTINANTVGVAIRGNSGETFCSISTGNTLHVYNTVTPAFVFYVNVNGGISNYSANNVNLSDEREKKNVEALPSQWDCLKHWDLKQFHYNADDDALPKKYGVIAQEIEAHCPEVIDVFKVDDDTERMGVKEQQMMWMAIKALQEAQTRIESLEARITALES
jgi:hypothetical protein